jgi:ABC-2 type transport system permease protein
MNFVKRILSRVQFKSKKYAILFWVNVKAQFAYRGIVLEVVFDYIMELILLLLLWRAIYGDNQILYGRSFSQMKGYLIASCTISYFFSYPSIQFLSLDIRNGEIAYTLIKPIDFQVQFFFKCLGRTVSYMIIVLPMCIIFARLSGATSSGNWIFAVASLLTGVIICICFDFFLGIICFWTENSWGIALARQVVLQYLSGAFVPLDCFPTQFTVIFRDYLPFSGIVYFPVQFATCAYTFSYFLNRMLLQTVWCLVFIILGRILYLIAKKKTFVNGG